MTLITTGNLICNDTPKPLLDIRYRMGYTMVCCAGRRTRQGGVCSRDLVQLSQNLEIILSPGEQGYDFLVVDRNQARGRRRCTAATPTNSTWQTSTTTLLRALTNITITGGGGCSSYQCGHHGAVAQQQYRRCLRREFCRRYRY